MSVSIFYFTGTGGSLQVSRVIGRKLEGELIPIMKAKGEDAIKPKDIVGFVFPVYYMDIPQIIKDILLVMDLSQTTYIFAAVTSGGDAGHALYKLDRILREKGKRLNYGLEIKLGDNSVIVKNKPEILKKRFDEIEKLSENIAHAVRNGETNTDSIHFQLKAPFISFITRFALERYYQIHNKSVNKEKCSLCGLCTQVCPADNIRISQGEVEWGMQCADCFACIHWCPQRAIRFGKIDLNKRGQYHFPGITTADLIK